MIIIVEGSLWSIHSLIFRDLHAWQRLLLGTPTMVRVFGVSECKI